MPLPESPTGFQNLATTRHPFDLALAPYYAAKAKQFRFLMRLKELRGQGAAKRLPGPLVKLSLPEAVKPLVTS